MIMPYRPLIGWDGNESEIPALDAQRCRRGVIARDEDDFPVYLRDGIAYRPDSAPTLSVPTGWSDHPLAIQARFAGYTVAHSNPALWHWPTCRPTSTA